MQGLFGKGWDIVFEKLIEFRVGDRHDLAAPGCLRHLAYQLLKAIPRAEQIQLVAVPHT